MGEGKWEQDAIVLQCIRARMLIAYLGARVWMRCGCAGACAGLERVK